LWRISYKGEPVFHFMGCSTFSNFTVLPETAVAKIRDDAPFRTSCYIGCGVTTGIGAVTQTAKVEPGVTAEPFQIIATYKTPSSPVAFTQNRSFVIPDSLRITPLTSDLFPGPIFNDKFQKADATPCSSGRGVDDETLEFTASRRLSSLPNDKKISTDHLTYSSHWSLDGNKVHVHRELEARFDQAVCTNPVKDEALTVLQTIRSDLATQISLTQAAAPAGQ